MPRVLTVQLHDGSQSELLIDNNRGITFEPDFSGFVSFEGKNGTKILAHKNHIALVFLSEPK